MNQIPPTKQKGTLKQFQSSRWSELNGRTLNGTSTRLRSKTFHDYILRGVELRMSRDEFNAWCSVNWAQAEALMNRNEIPSVDRIDSKGHYELNNLRLVSLKENMRQGREARWAQTAKKVELTEAEAQSVTSYIKNKRKLRDLKRRFFAAANKQLSLLRQTT